MKVDDFYHEHPDSDGTYSLRYIKVDSKREHKHKTPTSVATCFCSDEQVNQFGFSTCEVVGSGYMRKTGGLSTNAVDAVPAKIDERRNYSHSHVYYDVDENSIACSSSSTLCGASTCYNKKTINMSYDTI